MSTYTETVGKKLNNLLEKTYDAKKGYETAAENTDHTLLKQYFKKRSLERMSFGQDIKNEILKFSEEPEKDGSITGAVHRAWMDTKALFSANDAESMLEESIRGEKSAVQEYEDVLKDTALPVSTATLLSKQLQTIKSDLSTIKFLEDLS
ncbi:PA2169 family four-helix-bundle protein [Algibacter miyuki]|uniref:PA2169 family four-helix-bundle protein n=1 Tax=Algibacter miyuki TaxID=1306933 RepID=A0ABV5H0Y4_9FLAO|nr:PA2169 family four-helix-bundle protein [Algibacter miyuki]MDN3667384.1 PA2169 family four-helix-bundle protein [Algibacter miyuki]